jgi:hypothetical protein
MITGDVFRSADISAASELIVAYSRDPARVRTMGENARRHVQEFSSEAAVQGVVAAVAAIREGGKIGGRR